jgi:hypothetical protein
MEHVSVIICIFISMVLLFHAGYSAYEYVHDNTEDSILLPSDIVWQSWIAAFGLLLSYMIYMIHSWRSISIRMDEETINKCFTQWYNRPSFRCMRGEDKDLIGTDSSS